MKADMLAALRAVIQKGTATPKTPVTAVTPVTGQKSYGSKPLELRELRALRVENSKRGNGVSRPVTGPVTAPCADDDAAIDERAGMMADGVPAVYLDAWARLNCHKPVCVTDEGWRLALDDGGRYLDKWGRDAADWEWSPGDLLDVPRPGSPGGLIWRIAGRTVEAFGPEHVLFDDGKTFDRGRPEQ